MTDPRLGAGCTRACRFNGGALLLVTDGTANVAHLIDPATGASVADIPTGTKPDAAAFDPARYGLALVMNG